MFEKAENIQYNTVFKILKLLYVAKAKELTL